MVSIRKIILLLGLFATQSALVTIVKGASLVENEIAEGIIEALPADLVIDGPNPTDSDVTLDVAAYRSGHEDDVVEDAPGVVLGDADKHDTRRLFGSGTHQQVYPNPMLPNPMLPNPMLPNPMYPNPMLPNPVLQQQIPFTTALGEVFKYNWYLLPHDRVGRDVSIFTLVLTIIRDAVRYLIKGVLRGSIMSIFNSAYKPWYTQQKNYYLKALIVHVLQYNQYRGVLFDRIRNFIFGLPILRRLGLLKTITRPFHKLIKEVIVEAPKAMIQHALKKTFDYQPSSYGPVTPPYY